MKKNRKSFDAFARALQVLGLEALRAAEAKNAVSLLDIGARMEDVCESCHQTFWYPQEKRPAARNSKATGR
jgi:cytochrome c556